MREFSLNGRHSWRVSRGRSDGYHFRMCMELKYTGSKTPARAFEVWSSHSFIPRF